MLLFFLVFLFPLGTVINFSSFLKILFPGKKNTNKNVLKRAASGSYSRFPSRYGYGTAVSGSSTRCHTFTSTDWLELCANPAHGTHGSARVLCFDGVVLHWVFALSLSVSRGRASPRARHSSHFADKRRRVSGLMLG